ncbi:MAG: anhydro-N-acetylmuramic acid kinase, partial [Verrucomicrobiota bacterium]
PAAFALLAWLRWNNQPGNLPATTGARRPVALGQITMA